MTATITRIKPAIRDDAVDITLALRADIEKRDWNACHISGDKGVRVAFANRVRRMWRG